MRIPRSPLAVALSATALVGAGAAGGSLVSGGDAASAASGTNAATKHAQPCAARMAKRLDKLAGRLDVAADVRTAIRDARQAAGGGKLDGDARRAAAKPVLDAAVKAGKLKAATEDRILDRVSRR